MSSIIQEIQTFTKAEQLCTIILLVLSFAGWIQRYLPINYGKNQQSLFKTMIPNKYAWIIWESPNLIIFFYFLIYGKVNLTENYGNLFAIMPFFLHYVNRTMIYPLTNQTKTLVPIEIIIFGSTYTTANGYLQASRFLDTGKLYSIQLLKEPNFYFGLIVFCIGMYINIQSDGIINKMKKQLVERKEKKQYAIPRGGMYEYVSQANYFGEIVEWFGYGFMTFSFQSMFFGFSTLMNLSSRARDNHQWYLDNFKDYPKNRKAVLPFLY